MNKKRSYYRPYNPKTDYEEVINLQLRQSDIDEIRASSGLTPKEALIISLSVVPTGDLFVVIHDNKIEGVFGVETNGVVWFLATDKFKEFAYSFAKESKKWVQVMLEKYSFLHNYVSIHHQESIQWLEWLGFAIDYTKIFKTHYEGEFYYFSKGL